jgi:hypothetical protein
MGIPVYLWRGSRISADLTMRLDNTDDVNLLPPKKRMPYMIIHQIYSTPEGHCSKSKGDGANWQEEIFDPGRNQPMVRCTPETLSRAISALGINSRKENVVCFLLSNSPASEFYMPTFRNTLSVPSP